LAWKKKKAVKVFMKFKKVLVTLAIWLVGLLFIEYPLQAQIVDPVTPCFTDNGDGTANDNTTGLQWVIDPSSELLLAQDANKYCQKLRYAGHSDWRLPTEKELLESSFRYGHPFKCSGPSYWSYEASVSCNVHLAWYKRPLAFLLCYDTSFMRPVWPVRYGK
jgi:hypothetical protein